MIADPLVAVNARIDAIRTRIGVPAHVTVARPTDGRAFGEALAGAERSTTAAPGAWAAVSPALPMANVPMSLTPTSLTPTSLTPMSAGPTAGASTVATGASVDPAVVPYASAFESAAQRHGVPAELLAAVGWVESRYQPDARSAAGAEGIMQLMPFVSEHLGVDPWDPVQAIDGGARVLADHHRRFGSWELAVAAYHAGAGAVAAAGDQPPSERTATYVERVLERMEQM